MALATLAAMSFTAPASAHTLSTDRAMQRAEKVAYDYADVGEYYGASDCLPLKPHVNRCVIWSYSEETSETYGLYCDAYVKVRFISRKSHQTRPGPWYDSACDDEVTNEEADAGPQGGTDAWKWIWDGPLTQWPQVVF